MARILTTPDQWQSARLTWESEPLKTHADIGKILGISKQAVQRKAGADGWQKRITIEQATERAYQVADGIKKASEPVAVSPSAPDVVAAPPRIAPPTESAPEVLASAVDVAVAKRAEILDKHRMELAGPRSLAYTAIKTKDLNLARIAKATAETLKLTQECERKAWGFDREDGANKPTTVIINRRERSRG